MLTEASMSSSSMTVSKIRGCKGVTRQLYGRLQKHRGQRSSFSNKKSKRMMSKRRYSNVQNYCINNSGRRQKDEKGVLRSSEDVHQYEQACIDAMERIACVACKMQYKIANTFWNRCCEGQMKTETDELRSKRVNDQLGSGRNNVQLTETVDTHSTDVHVDTAGAPEMPAVWVSSARSARCEHTPFTSAPAQH